MKNEVVRYNSSVFKWCGKNGIASEASLRNISFNNCYAGWCSLSIADKTKRCFYVRSERTGNTLFFVQCSQTNGSMTFKSIDNEHEIVVIL